MTYPQVSIIILNWNGKNDTVECLNSLKKIDYPNYEITIVDNGSTDGSQKEIRRKFPHVRLIENSENLGFAEGNNIGIKHALEESTDYILLLNNDTVVDKRFLNELIDVAQKDERIGIVGPKIYFHEEPNKIWFAGGMIDLKKGSVDHIGWGESDQGQYDEKKEVDYITACCSLVKRGMIEKGGMFDPKFFIYYEDTDLNLRVKKTGYKIVYVPSSKIWHKVSASMGGDTSPEKLYLKTRNLILFVRKNANMKEKILFTYHFLKRNMHLLLSLTLRGRWGAARAVIKGILYHLWVRF